MDLAGLSEINFGLIIRKIKTASMYDPDIFFPPYDEAIAFLKKHPKASVEDVTQVIAPSAYHSAEKAAISVNGMGNTVDWPAKLQRAFDAYQLGRMMKKNGEKLEKNEDVDFLEMQGRAQKFIEDQSAGGLAKLKDIDYEGFQPFQQSGWDLIDNIFGGIPNSGLLVAFGETGMGKSFWLSKLFKEYLLFHKKKTGAVYTLEMTGEEYAQRSVKMYPDLMKAKDRFYISGMARKVDEIIAEVTSKRLDIVGIDFVDWLVDEASEPAYTYVYKRLVELGRMLGITVVLLAQPNREGVKYKKFLTKFDLRWTGMAENSAWQLIALQEANHLDIDDTKYPSYDDDHLYMINLKQRGGWPKQIGPGAIIIEPGSKAKWDGKAKNNKLWKPGDYGTKTTRSDRPKR